MHAMIDNYVTLETRMGLVTMYILARIYFVKNLNGSRFVLILETRGFNHSALLYSFISRKVLSSIQQHSAVIFLNLYKISKEVISFLKQHY